MMSESFLAVQVAGERIAIPAGAIGQVIEPETVVPVPGTPDFITGVTSVRSNILTILDIAKIIGVESAAHSSSGCVVTMDRKECGYGLLVESVVSIVESHEPIAGVSLDLEAAWQSYSLGSIDTDQGRMLVIDTAALIDEPLNNLTGPQANPTKEGAGTCTPVS